MQTNVLFAEGELGTGLSKSNIFGVLWNKNNENDVNLNISGQVHAKRGMLKFLASFLDPLGLISSVMLIEKNVYRLGCYLKLTWTRKYQRFCSKNGINWCKVYLYKLSFQEVYAGTTVNIILLNGMPLKTKI